MADIVIAALHQRKGGFLTLMLQSCLADSSALKTNNYPGQHEESCKRRRPDGHGRKENVELLTPYGPPFQKLFNSFLFQVFVFYLPKFTTFWAYLFCLHKTPLIFRGLVLFSLKQKTHNKQISEALISNFSWTLYAFDTF